MKLPSRRLRLTASDLAGYLACRHLVELERAVTEGKLRRPYRDDPALQRIIERGQEFEAAYVRSLSDQGRDVVNLSEVEGEDALTRVNRAMRDGAGVIVQAPLEEGRWSGRADLLVRIDDHPSELGSWSYEVVDTKLARQTKGETILQLSLYSDLLSSFQGVPPEHFRVVTPSGEEEGVFVSERFRLADFQAYYRLVRRRLEEWVNTEARPLTYPDPVPHCEICHWWPECDRKRHDDDHLSLVAGMQRLHQKELERQSIVTLTDFASQDQALPDKPERGHQDTFDHLHKQAEVQLEGRRRGNPFYDFVPVEAGRGLTRLPEPSPGDLFFDIESDPFVGTKGLEFLFGYITCEAGEAEYHAEWATKGSEEKRVFESFIHFLMERLEEFPEMHIYHFSPYEPAALKRLMGRHAVGEDDVDRLLRGERFVDLHAVTRQGLRMSVESYSLKELEIFYQFERSLPLREARAALDRVDRALEFRIPEEISMEDRSAVETYNREDCLSTLRLRDWLEERRSELVNSEESLDRPAVGDGDAPENVEERRQQVQVIYDALTEGLPEEPNHWNETEKVRSLLANLLDYFRREDKCTWWELFRMGDLEHEELLDERKAVSGLEFVEKVGGTVRCPVHRYCYPEQEVSLGPGDELRDASDVMRTIGSVHAVDLAGKTLDIKKREDTRETHFFSVVAFDLVSTRPLEGSLLAFARSIADGDLEGTGSFKAARDLLLRKTPDIDGHVPGMPLRQKGEPAVDAACRLAPLLQDSYLPIQGPPGTGKTFTGARMIVKLASEGMRVGVTAVSHAVIRNLLQATIEVSDETGTLIWAVHKGGDPLNEENDRLEQISGNSAALAALDEGKVVGGTCWLWSRDDAVEQLDYLFIDEAGQLSLAMLLAASRAARNLILLGDPQQLEQPQQGSHPDGADTSALQYVLGENQTIRDHQGLFLDRTWRLHPGICQLTSELYYERRLEAREGLEQQAIVGQTRFQGSGLFLQFVEHDGNQNSSLEEVHAIQEIIRELLESKIEWIDRDGSSHELGPEEILVIAPDNAQVAALTRALPCSVRVGTVDKFQGQEAPVVIYSMTSSSVYDAPRGMSFLYNPNRFNVATSRAKCICIAVGSPELFEPDCRTPDQMRWANALCRFREIARSDTQEGLYGSMGR